MSTAPESCPGSSPEFLRLDLPVAGRAVGVVGNDLRAAVTVVALVEQRAHVRLLAPDRVLAPVLCDLADRGVVDLAAWTGSDADLEGLWLVLPRTGDPLIDHEVAAAADRLRVWCLDEPPARAAATTVRGGRVTIVGGGPGVPGLMTVQGKDALMRADVVVFDRLAPVSLLADLPSTTILIDASKVPGGRAMPQHEINRHLVEHALAGLTVVRLKGGDAFVFGRGMEEVDSCTAAGVPVEVIPGVSSVTGVPALAGISLTQRGITHAFTVVSGHVAPETDPSRVDWGALAEAGATLVLVMAVENMGEIAATLLAAGMDPDVPTATVQEGGTASQRVVRSTLARLAADTADIRPPAITVIGDVVGHSIDVPEPLPALLPALPHWSTLAVGSGVA